VPKENTENSDDDKGVKHLVNIGSQPEESVKKSKIKSNQKD
jgi:hypothetical protein